MRILIATDAWHPQVNGVVRTLTSLARAASRAGRRNRLPDPRGISLAGRSDLSGIAGGADQPARNRTPGSRRPRRTPSISRPKARSAGRCAAIAAATSLRSRPPTPRASRNISRSARSFRRASATRCCGTFIRRQHDHGRDPFAAAGAWPARLQEARLLDPRRRHRSVQPGRSGRARFAAADLHDRRPRRGREEHRGVSVARPAGIQGRDRGRAAEGGAGAALSESPLPRRKDRQRI